MEKPWRLSRFIFCHLLALTLIFSLALPFTRAGWEAVDIAFFKEINGTLEGSPSLQLFWACANHRMADWFEDLVILGFFFLYVRSLPKEERLRGVARLLFCLLYIAAILFFVNRLLFREHLIIYRDSPTLVVEPCVRLSEEIPWMRIKDDSNKCFPGDHATTAVLFAATYSFYAGRRLGSAAWGYALFLCMPRMIVGAHWLSDVVVGGGSIALLLLSWAFCTPLHLIATQRLESLLTFFKRSKRVGT